MGMVFQQFNLFPHMDIIKNLTLAPVKLQGKSQEEAEAQAMALLERVGLADRAHAYPKPALRRPEAANRHCPGLVHEAGRDAL